MGELERNGEFSNNGIVVHRGISAEDFGDIDLNKVGVFWTWAKDKAANYSGHNTSLPLHILTALIRMEDIDLEETFFKVVWPGYYLGDESEKEITLKENRKLYLDSGEEIKT